MAAVLACAMALPAASQAATLTPLCVQLKWTHQAQFAGMYVAKQKGFYKAAGLDLNFMEGGPATNWQETLANPVCPLGVINTQEILIAASKGAPVRAIAALNQNSPIVWFSLKKSGITNPRHFKGRKMALVPTGKLLLYGMLKNLHIDPKSIAYVPFSVDLGPLYRGEVDVWSGYHPNLITRARSDGYAVNIISPVDYGVEVYDDVIYASTALIEQQPALVTAFLRATVQGWLDVIRDTDYAMKAVGAVMTKPDMEFQRSMLMQTLPYIYTGEAPIGWMEPVIWKESAELAYAAGMIKSIPPASSTYNDSFIKEAQGKR